MSKFAFKDERDELFEIIIEASLDMEGITKDEFIENLFDGKLKPAGRDICLYCTRPVSLNNFRAIRHFDEKFKDYFTFYFHKNCSEIFIDRATEEGNRRYG